MIGQFKFVRLLATGGEHSARLSLFKEIVPLSESRLPAWRTVYKTTNPQNDKIHQWPNRSNAIEYAKAEVEVHHMTEVTNATQS